MINLKVSALPDVLDSVVVLRRKQMEMYETPAMTQAYITYRHAYYKTDDVYAHEYTTEDFNAVGLTDVDTIITIKNNIRDMLLYLTEDTMDKLLTNKRKQILNGYVETNRYVKALMGEPYDDSVKVYLPYEIDGFDMSKSIDQFNSSEIALLNAKGVIDELIKLHPTLLYLKYVYRKIPFLTTRESDLFGLLYVDTSTNDGYEFMERYELTRLTFNRTMYNEMYYELYPLYENMMITFILASTLFELMATEPYSIADFDFSSEDTLMSIYETFSIPFIETLPTSIKISLGEKLNKIILNKGSKSSLIDIIESFGITDIYQYVLYKEYADKYDASKTAEENYKLSFVRVPIDAKNITRSLINATDDDKIDYDTFVNEDRKWGVEGDNLRSLVLSKDFSYLRTKYVGTNETIDLIKDLYSSSRFMSYIFMNKSKMSNFTITLERSSITVNIWELFVYSIALLMIKNGYEDTILRDTESLAYVYGLNSEYVIENETLELFRLHLPEKYHKFLTWKSASYGLPITEFMNVILDNEKLLNELQSVLLNYDGQFSTYRYLQKIEEIITNVKRNDALGDLTGYETYSEYIDDNNHTLFTYMETLKESDDLDSDLSDELLSIISDIEDLLNTSNLNDINMSNLYFINKMKSDEMNTIQIALFKIMAFLKSYTIDLKQNEKRNIMYDNMKTIDGAFATIYANGYSRLYTNDDVVISIGRSTIQSFAYVTDTVSHKNDTLQIMGDEYIGNSFNNLCEYNYIDDYVVRNAVLSSPDKSIYSDNIPLVIATTYLESTYESSDDNLICVRESNLLTDIDTSLTNSDEYVMTEHTIGLREDIVVYLDAHSYMRSTDMSKWLDSSGNNNDFDVTDIVYDPTRVLVGFNDTSTVCKLNPDAPIHHMGFNVTMEFMVTTPQDTSILYTINDDEIIVLLTPTGVTVQYDGVSYPITQDYVNSKRVNTLMWLTMSFNMGFNGVFCDWSYTTTSCVDKNVDIPSLSISPISSMTLQNTSDMSIFANSISYSKVIVSNNAIFNAGRLQLLDDLHGVATIK